MNLSVPCLASPKPLDHPFLTTLPSLGSWGNNLYGSTGVPGSVDIGIKTGDMGDSLPFIPLGSSGPGGPQMTATAVASGWRHNCAIVGDELALGDLGGRVKW